MQTKSVTLTTLKFAISRKTNSASVKTTSTSTRRKSRQVKLRRKTTSAKSRLKKNSPISTHKSPTCKALTYLASLCPQELMKPKWSIAKPNKSFKTSWTWRSLSIKRASPQTLESASHFCITILTMRRRTIPILRCLGTQLMMTFNVLRSLWISFKNSSPGSTKSQILWTL